MEGFYFIIAYSWAFRSSAASNGLNYWNSFSSYFSRILKNNLRTYIPNEFMYSFVERGPYDLGQNDHFAQIKVEHISITGQELNRIIDEIVLDDDNLSFVFSQNINGNDGEKDLALRRFLPDSRPANLMDYIFDEIQKNRSFYSFLGEVILAICVLLKIN